MTWFKALRRLGRVDRHSDSRDPNGGPVASESKTERGRTGIRADNPIRQPEEDTLGRRKIAETFAQQVIALDVSEGVVVGVLGPWGSGKTSFVNLARTEFERAGVPILDFNPWMFSGAQQLVDSFFVEVAAQLKIRPGLADVSKDQAPVSSCNEAFAAWEPLRIRLVRRMASGSACCSFLKRRNFRCDTDARGRLPCASEAVPREHPLQRGPAPKLDRRVRS